MRLIDDGRSVAAAPAATPCTTSGYTPPDVSTDGCEPRFPDLSKQELDALIDQLMHSAEGVKTAQGRLRALLGAIETVRADLNLESVLRSTVGGARGLTHARFAALAVLGAEGSFERLVYAGTDGDPPVPTEQLPRGSEILRIPAGHARPHRAPDPGGDADRVRWPTDQPPMNSLLRVPVHVRSEIFGSLYLGDSESGAFSEEDEELVVALAVAAGTAISNARLYEDSRQQQRWLEASIDIGSQLLAAGAAAPMSLIAQRARETARADLACVSLLSTDRGWLCIEAADGTKAGELAGQRFAVHASLGGTAVLTGVPVLVDDASAGNGLPSYVAGVLEPGPLMALPLHGRATPRGVLSVVRERGRPPFTPTEMAMAAGFAAHASIALELADSRAGEERLAVLEDRDRIAMDLHDHVIQELFATGLGLEGVVTQLGPGHPLTTRVERGVESIDRTIRQIRTTIYELRGDLVNVPNGLRPTLRTLIDELTPTLQLVPQLTVAGLIDEQVDSALADDVVAVVRETLTNVAKHARATRSTVHVTATAKAITVAVSDNGVGPGDKPTGRGTADLTARANRWNGSFTLATGPDGGTVATWKARLT
jgi:signal transduction histidine kinase